MAISKRLTFLGVSFASFSFAATAFVMALDHAPWWAKLLTLAGTAGAHGLLAVSPAVREGLKKAKESREGWDH